VTAVGSLTFVVSGDVTASRVVQGSVSLRHLTFSWIEQ